MKQYKTPDSDIYAYELDGSQDHLIPSDYVAITDEEVSAILKEKQEKANQEWSLNGDYFDGLVWLEESPKPTQAELDALWESTQAAVAKDACKTKAKELLSASDWTQMPDVSLVNKDAFAFYRLNLRNLVLNPVADPVWEAEPTPVWQ